MKYTDRKKTPLKWHHFLTYFLVPLFTLMNIFNLLSLINELFNLHMSGMGQTITPVIQSFFGVTINNLGPAFWYVVGYFALQIIVTVLLVIACIGFFSWKEQARKSWLWYLLISTIEGAAFAFVSFYLYHRDPTGFNSVLIAIVNTGGSVITTPIELGSIVVSMFIGAFIIEFLFLLLNAAYYNKRKPLFVETYVAPEYAASSNPAEEQKPVEAAAPETQTVSEPAPAAEPVTAEPAAEAVDAASESTPEEAPVEPVEEPAAPAEPAPEPVASDEVQTEAPAEPAAEQPKKIMKYCPNCGSELGEHDAMFCTHCGQKLK